MRALPAVPRECMEEFARHLKAEHLNKGFKPWWGDESVDDRPPRTVHALLTRIYALDRNVRLRRA